MYGIEALLIVFKMQEKMIDSVTVVTQFGLVYNDNLDK